MDGEESGAGALSRMLSTAQSAAPATGNNQWLAFAAGLGAPTRTGALSEAVAAGAGALYNARQEDEKLRAQYTTAIMRALQPQVMGRSLVDPLTGRIIATDQVWAQEQQLERQRRIDAQALEDARKRELAAAEETRRREAAAAEETRKREKAADDRAHEERMARLRAELRPAAAEPAVTVTEIQDPADPSRTLKIDARSGRTIGVAASKPKPVLPTAALKMQDENTNTIGALSGLNADISALRQQLENKNLNVGPLNNLISRGLNYANMSTPESRNYATLRSALERMRNESLRLNKGVQTEGDSVRAWNELFENLNDQEVVKKRLEEIETLNRRAIDLKMIDTDAIRANFGAEPMDFSKWTNVNTAVKNAVNFDPATKDRAGKPTALPAPKTKSEYDKLAPGEKYTAPDGSVRTKR